MGRNFRLLVLTIILCAGSCFADDGSAYALPSSPDLRALNPNVIVYKELDDPITGLTDGDELFDEPSRQSADVLFEQTTLEDAEQQERGASVGEHDFEGNSFDGILNPQDGGHSPETKDQWNAKATNKASKIKCNKETSGSKKTTTAQESNATSLPVALSVFVCVTIAVVSLITTFCVFHYLKKLARRCSRYKSVERRPADGMENNSAPAKATLHQNSARDQFLPPPDQQKSLQAESRSHHNSSKHHHKSNFLQSVNVDENPNYWPLEFTGHAQPEVSKNLFTGNRPFIGSAIDYSTGHGSQKQWVRRQSNSGTGICLT